MSTVPANWYPDPHDPSQLRYWDGHQWTDHRAPNAGGRPRADARPGRGLPSAVLVAALATAVIAVPYWSSSYAAVHDDGIFAWFWLVELVLFPGTVLAGLLSHARLWAAMAMMFACVPIAVMGRVVIDTAGDPTSHNLWPFEVVLSMIISIPAICAGALLAWAIRWRTRSPR
jgi:Protein of unknown function (DUF2510)